MSTAGQSPRAKRIRFTPQATDPVNPAEGDMFHSDGSARAEGPWVYQNGAWQQINTSGAFTSVNDLTYVPQSADPGSPVEGMLFYSDGTVRTVGFWVYNGTGWVQVAGAERFDEFFVKAYTQVRVATTAAITLASQAENGDTIDGVVLATGNRILIKNQVTATENGVYIVAVSGAPTRATDADAFEELNLMSVLVNEGTTNKNTSWFQTATLTSLATNQVWATTPGAQTFIVPDGVDKLWFTTIPAGGGGGGGSGIPSGAAGVAGGGGGAAPCETVLMVPVTSGETITITLGEGGNRGLGGINTNGSSGGAGGITTISGSFGIITFYGGNGGGGGLFASSAGGIAATTASTTLGGIITPVVGGAGGGNGGGTNAAAGTNGQATILNDGGTGGSASGGTFRGGGGGGGGASNQNDGGTGGTGMTSASYVIATPTNSNAGQEPVLNRGGGGGGGGGTGQPSGGGRTGASGGAGGCAYVRADW